MTIQEVTATYLGHILVTKSRDPIYTVPFIGFSDIDAVDFTEGIASGFFKRDVRGQLDGCLNGVPELGMKILGTSGVLFHAINTQGMGVLLDLEKIQQIFDLMFTMARSIPGEFKACTALTSQATEFTYWAIKHLNPSTFTVSLAMNLIWHGMALLGDVYSITTSLFSHDFYTIG